MSLRSRLRLQLRPKAKQVAKTVGLQILLDLQPEVRTQLRQAMDRDGLTYKVLFTEAIQDYLEWSAKRKRA